MAVEQHNIWRLGRARGELRQASAMWKVAPMLLQWSKRTRVLRAARQAVHDANWQLDMGPKEGVEPPDPHIKLAACVSRRLGHAKLIVMDLAICVIDWTLP